jgi:uncharacterized protein YbjT (DUF2867 family)
MNILVTGATGTVGAHVVRELRKRGLTVSAFVRDRQKATQMLGTDVELAVGDFADRGSIERALQGVDRVFLACANTPGQIEYECATIDAARAAGVSQVVKLSGPGAAVDSALLFERWHGEIERHLLQSGVAYVLLRPSAYMTNLLAYAETIKHTGKLFAPAGAAQITYVDPRDVAAVAAVALATDGHAGRTYHLTGPEAISYARIARDLSTATGRQIEYFNVPDEAARQAMIEAGLPSMVAEAIVAVFASQRAGSQARVTDAVRALTGRERRSFAEFARDYAAVFGATAVYAEPGGGLRP